MTYCLAICVADGMVVASDSRTNAGVDQVSTYSKMHRVLEGERGIVTIVTAGNLATTQAVIRKIRRDMKSGAEPNLATFKHLSDVSEYVGRINASERRKHASKNPDGFSPDASFIIGGQLPGERQQLFLVYPQGNYIRAPKRAPYLQIGESKYGKPILDRIITRELSLDDAVKCAMVSFDSTMRSNAAVGPPVELLICRADRYEPGRHVVFEEDDSYLRDLRLAWQESLASAFATLPALPPTDDVSN